MERLLAHFRWHGLALGLSLFLAGISLSEDNSRSEDALRRKLETRVGVVWSAQTLRQNLAKLSASLEMTIWLDRRIDPSQQLELTLSDTPLRGLLDAVASRIDAGVATVGAVVYIGPKDMARKIATLAALRNDEAGRFPPDVSMRQLHADGWKWDELATPRELLESLSRNESLKIEGLQTIPHDLWPAADLPPLTVGERLTLLLAGFDLTFAWEDGGRRVRLVAAPDSPTLVQTYTAARDAANFQAQLQAAAPQASMKRDSNRIVVTGRAEDHEAIRHSLAKDKSRTLITGPAKTVYDMKGPAPLGNVLKTLQETAGLRLTIDPAVQKKLYERVHFEVTKASMEELIQAVMKDTGLRYELTGRDLKIFPAGKKDE